MMPLIDRLKAERQEMMTLHGNLTNQVRHLKIASQTDPDEAQRRAFAVDYARAAHTLFRVQFRLGELRQEIKDENIRLTAALTKAKAAARKRDRGGSNSLPLTEKATV